MSAPMPPLSPLRHPPRLRSAEGETHRHVTWLELFFDLVFVAAVAQLAALLVADSSFEGFLWFAGLFVPLAWAWMGYTYYANRFDTDDFPYRLTVSAAMLAVAAMAVAIGETTAAGTVRFALAYIALRVLLLVLYLRARRHVPSARAAIDAYLAGFGLGALLWIVSIAVPPPYRYALWAAGLAVEFATPLVAWRVIGGTPVDREHVEERFGLFTIIVLGEAVIAVVVGTDTTGWAAESVAVAAFGFIGAVALWWIYFDFHAGARVRPGRWAFVSVYGHVPLWIALTAFGAGTKLAVKHADDLAQEPGERWAVAGGAALALAMVAAFHWASEHREPLGLGAGRLAVVAGLIALAAGGGPLPLTTFMVLVTALLGLALLIEGFSMRESARGAFARMVQPPQKPGLGPAAVPPTG
jgi:low temperature requirement protein LtrA